MRRQFEMICPNCNSDNPDVAAFCANCGTRLSGSTGEPEGVSTPGSFGSSNVSGPAINVTPRDIGGIISETFVVYRSQFLAFFFIALVPQLPFLVFSAFASPMFFFGVLPQGQEFGASDRALAGGAIGAFLVLFILALILGVVSLAASIHAVGQHYLANRVDIMAAISRGFYRFFYIILTGILIFLILIIPGLLSIVLLGIPIFLFLLVRIYFSFQAVVLEDQGPIEGISRSWDLVRDNWWRTFVIGVLFFLISIAIFIGTAVVTVPLTLFASPIVSSFVSTIVNALVTPIMVIGATLVYLDLRVRREGQDLVIAV